MILECQVCLEYLNPGRSFVSKKVNHKNCTLRLIRNEFREILLDVTENKKKQVLREEVKFVTVHKKFAAEGKATIKFEKKNLNLFISNAPTIQLHSFLKFLNLKVNSGKGCELSARQKLLSSKTPYIEDISPLTKKDVEKGRKKKKKSEESGSKTVLENEIKARKNCMMEVAKMSLTDEQREVLEAAKAGHNVFFTGSAGTGKSHLLKSIITALPPDVTFATASTAIAACQIGGMTLHQFAGIGRGDGTLEHCTSLALQSNTWKKCRHLIIDEISMVDGAFFEKLECISRYVRRNDKPFGGIQLIVCGDFFQLPPVGPATTFAFQSEAWDRCITHVFELRKIQRQSDPVLVNILQSVRVGKVTEEITEILRKTATQVIENNGIVPTRLCTHTAESSAINTEKLQDLPGDAKTYKASNEPDSLSKFIDKQSRVPDSVTLKVGAQVMLLKNLDLRNGLVNGARGVVVKFDSDNLPVVRFASAVRKIGREKFVITKSNSATVARTQIPLTLAWAISIHKSQGLTLDCAELSLTRVFEAGHAYVALSRVKGLDCLRVLDFDSKQVWANEKVINYYKKFRKAVESRRQYALGK